MSYNHFYKRLEQTALAMFPGLAGVPVSWDHLISPLELKISAGVREHAEAAIRALHAIAHRDSYARLLEPMPGISDAPAKNESALMAYDFHTDESGECSLVEVNTNASGFLLSSLMHLAHSEEDPKRFQPLLKLRATFENELKMWGKAAGTPAIAITDEDIPAQKMYPEFVMYRDWFRSLGWSAELVESRDFVAAAGKLNSPALSHVDLVYDRLTDFYLENPQHQNLRRAYVEQAACFSPNPREYWLLSDKQRLVDLGRPGFLQKAGASEAEIAALERVLIPTFNKGDFASEDAIWHERRNLFFKPKRSFGGKSVYRGESVSRKVFERLMQDDILIQHFRPAQRVPTDDPRSVLNNWKFDLRFFVYADQVQMVAARIYQGQVTNFSSPLGGFTLVR